MYKTFENPLRKYADKVINKAKKRGGTFTESELKTLYILANTWGLYKPRTDRFPNDEIDKRLGKDPLFYECVLIGRIVNRIIREIEVAWVEAEYAYASLSDLIKQCSAIERTLTISAEAYFPLTKEECDALTQLAKEKKRGGLVSYLEAYADIVSYLQGHHYNLPAIVEETGKEILPSEALKIVETYEATDGKGRPLSERVSRQNEEVTLVCKSDPSIRVDLANMDSPTYRAYFVEEGTNKFLLEKVMQPVAKTRREIEKLAGYKLSCSDADIDAYMSSEFLSYTDLKLTVEDRRALIAYRESIPKTISHADIEYEWDSIPEERSPRTLYDCLKTVGTEKNYPDSANDPVLFFADEVKKYFPELDQAITQYIAETTPQLTPNGSITLSELKESNSVAGVWYSLKPTNSEILGELQVKNSFSASLFHVSSEKRVIAVTDKDSFSLGQLDRTPFYMSSSHYLELMQGIEDQTALFIDKVLPTAFNRLSELESFLFAILSMYGQNGMYKALPSVTTLAKRYNDSYEELRLFLFERIFGNVEERHKSLERYRKMFPRLTLPAKNAKQAKHFATRLTDIKEGRVVGHTFLDALTLLNDSDIMVDTLDFKVKEFPSWAIR